MNLKNEFNCIWKRNPEYYPNSLWAGKCIEAFDGLRQMGTITVKEIFNPILDGDERK